MPRLRGLRRIQPGAIKYKKTGDILHARSQYLTMGFIIHYTTFSG